ncbi:MAG: sigma-70 family RNA polymerase sigma factor [Spirochaetota bacterium]
MEKEGPRRVPGSEVDEEVIQRVLDGDTEAFALLVRRHSQRVHRIGFAWFRDHDDAEDLVQEVFSKAYSKLASFRGGSLFSTWLIRIAYNTATTGKARKRVHEEFREDAFTIGTNPVEAEAVARESAREVRAALATLSPEQAICVELAFFQDLSYIEISKASGFPVNTVKSHVFRAKRLLRERLDPGLGGMT